MGQIVSCGDSNKLGAWTQTSPRRACYRSLDDYKTVVHLFERRVFFAGGFGII